MRQEESEPNNSDARQQLDRWLGFLRRAVRFWPLPLGALLIGCIACGVFLHFKTPLYRSETVIFYVEKGTTEEPVEASAARTVTLRLKELLMSRATLERVIKQFDLYPDQRRTVGMIDAIEEFKKHIDFRSPGGDAISIAFDGDSPNQAQTVTAELARSVIDSDSELRKGQARVAQEFLTNENRDSEVQLRETEQKLAAFMAQHPRFALDATPLTNGAAIRATLGGGQTTGGFARQPAAGAGWASAAARPLSSGPSSAPVSPGDSHNTVALARAAVAAAQENLTEQLARYTPAHPDVRAAQAALTRANERLAAVQAGGAPQAAAAPVEHAAPDSGSVQAPTPPTPPRMIAPAPPTPGTVAATAARSSEQTKELVDLETQWLTLTRAVTEARQRQDQVEEQLFKADIQANSEGAGHGAQVNIIDPAFLPQGAIPPGRATIALLFLSISLALGVLGALVRAAFDDRMFEARDVAGISEVLVEIPRISRNGDTVPQSEVSRLELKVIEAEPVVTQVRPVDNPAPPSPTALAVRPHKRESVVTAKLWSTPVVVLEEVEPPASLDPRLVVLSEPSSAQARSYRLLHHRLIAHSDPRVITVTSAWPDEGKTTCAANLALSLADETFARVLLIEANVRRPGLAQAFGFRPADSFMNKLLQVRDARPPYLVARVRGTRLHVAALRLDAPRDARLDRLLLGLAISDLRASYDYIIIDAASLFESADADVAGECADGVIVTARAAKSRRAELRNAIDQLSPTPVLGVVLLDT